MDDETAAKIADATKEVAKTTGIALEIVRNTGEFLNRLVGESLTELGQAVTDRIRAWRVRNLIAAAAEARVEVEALGAQSTLRPLPMGDAVRWIEGASQEDEPEMQTLWARLLINAADPATAVRVDKVIVGILQQLMPIDAKVLGFLQQQGWNVFTNVSGGFGVERLARELQFNEPDVWQSIANLWRLGCLIQQAASPTTPDAIETVVGAVHNKSATYRPSSLGNALWKAVSSKGSG